MMPLVELRIGEILYGPQYLYNRRALRLFGAASASSLLSVLELVDDEPDEDDEDELLDAASELFPASFRECGETTTRGVAGQLGAGSSCG